jgi:parallel beta-helix repeat protein
MLITVAFTLIDLNSNFMQLAKGVTIYVGGGGSGNYSTIQEGVDAANDGDMVFVYGKSPGRYYEWVLIDKNIDLIGEDRNTTIIDGGGFGSIINIAPLVADITVSGFGIIYGECGIWVGGGPVTISNNDIHAISGEAIWVDSSNNMISNNIIDSSMGIRLNYGSSGNTVKDNTLLSLNTLGISLYSSKDNIITGNIMMDCGIYLSGNFEHWTQNFIDISNTVNGKPVYYWKNQIGGTIPSGAGQVILANGTNIKVENQELNDCTVGIEIGYSSNITITESDVMRNWYGIYMWYSDGINISHNYVSSNVYGIDINHSARNNVIYNTIYSHDVFDTGKGINLWHSKENNIIGNDASYFRITLPQMTGLIYIFQAPQTIIFTTIIFMIFFGFKPRTAVVIINGIMDIRVEVIIGPIMEASIIKEVLTKTFLAAMELVIHLTMKVIFKIIILLWGHINLSKTLQY